jgi:exopolysaccharide biosynthesis protein
MIVLSWRSICHAQSPTPSATPISVTWEKLVEGLEETHFQIPGSALLSPSVVAVRADPTHYSLRVVRAAEHGWKKATARQFCKASGASVCINSNFFDEQGKPLGVVISRGIQHHKIHSGGGTLTGVLFATADSIGITHRSTFSAEKVIEASQAGPRLISEGAPVVGVKDSSTPTNLSIACIDKRGSLLLLRVSLALFGSSLKEVQSALLLPELGCVEALNFDGGGSSQMYITSEVTGHPGATRREDLPGRDEVPVAVCLFPKKG